MPQSGPVSPDLHLAGQVRGRIYFALVTFVTIRDGNVAPWEGNYSYVLEKESLSAGGADPVATHPPIMVPRWSSGATSRLIGIGDQGCGCHATNQDGSPQEKGVFLRVVRGGGQQMPRGYPFACSAPAGKWPLIRQLSK
jgi:hypothetical protein